MMSAMSIQLPDDGPCAFCAYLSGERPYTVLARYDLIAVLVTREQRGVSHLLVVPIRHAQTILDVNEGESAALMRGVRAAARVIATVEGSPGIAIWQNNGVPAAQAIGHLHFHVAGTLPEGGTEWGDVEEMSIAETERIAQRLRRGAAL